MNGKPPPSEDPDWKRILDAMVNVKPPSPKSDQQSDCDQILKGLTAMWPVEKTSCDTVIYSTNSSVGNITFPLSNNGDDVKYLDPGSLKKREDELKLQLAAARQRIALVEDTDKYIAQGPPK